MMRVIVTFLISFAFSFLNWEIEELKHEIEILKIRIAHLEEE